MHGGKEHHPSTEARWWWQHHVTGEFYWKGTATHQKTHGIMRQEELSRNTQVAPEDISQKEISKRLGLPAGQRP